MRTLLICFVTLNLAMAAYASSGEAPLEYVDTSAVEVCSVPLPLSQSGLHFGFLQLNHVYIKVNNQTFGTPFTNRRGYFGGDSTLYSEDPIRREHLERNRPERCYPVKRQANDEEQAFAKRVQCIARKFSIGFYRSGTVRKDWLPYFDYNFFDNNCGSMARFLVRCGGGKSPRLFNYTIGDDVPDNKPAKMVEAINGIVGVQVEENETVTNTTYGAVCERALTECEAEENVEQAPVPVPNPEPESPVSIDPELAGVPGISP